MERTITVNGDKRYYLDEDLLLNPGSITDTIIRFNDIKIHLYNCLYDKKYLGRSPFGTGTYDSFLKDEYGINSYYTCSIYETANGMLSSQRELHSMYKSNLVEDIKARQRKIASVSGDLEKKQRIKDSIRTFVKTGKWVKPYPKCTLKACGEKLVLYNKKTVNLDSYERETENAVRRLKNRLAMLRQGLSRKEAKLQDLKDNPPRRVLFGTKKFYRQKDAADDTAAWKEEFALRRHHSITLSGRHTSACGNFLVYLCGNDLHVKCMDGKEAVFRDFHPARYEGEYLRMLSSGPADRKPIGYSFRRETDQDGRGYIVPSVILKLEDHHLNQGFDTGCVAIDQNWDNITLSDIDEKGRLLYRKTIRFQLEGKTAGQASNIIGNVMAEAGDYCRAVRKCLAIEDIDTARKRNGMRYGSKKGNRHASLFAYQKITSCAYSQGFQKGFEVYKVDPAYTSQIAKIRYMRKMGCSIHEAASYTIGLKAMGLTDLLTPPKLLKGLLPQKLRESEDIWPQWRHICAKLKGVRTHLFYGPPPEEELAALKKPTLASYAKALKDRDRQKPEAAWN